MSGGRPAIVADVAVAGGGVAGSSLAAALAAAGLGVVVVEREAAFRDRVRGESIHPWGIAEADRLGLLPTLRAAGGWALPRWQRYDDREPAAPHRWAEHTPGGHVEWTVSHPAMQEALLPHAAELGARVLRPAKVVGFRRGASGSVLNVATEDGPLTVRARLVVGADGATSAARRWVGAATRADPPHHAIGGTLLAGVGAEADTTHQAYFPGGMAVLFPRGDGIARAYVVCDNTLLPDYRGVGGGAAMVRRLAAVLPAGSVDGAEVVGPTAFFPNADRWADRLHGDGVVLVGDAAGANDPSQGHGLSLAFRDALELRNLLLDGRDWRGAVAEYAVRRAAYFATLRAHARWVAPLTTGIGPEADARRARVERARELDPSAGGFAMIHALGPDGLIVDEGARRRFLGEEFSPVERLSVAS